MWPMPGAPALAAKGGFGTVDFSWTNPTADGLVGMYLYRGSSPDGPFTRITAEPVTGTTYRDTVDAGTYVYMARPIYLQSNGSGSFLDPGQGQIVGNVFVEAPRTLTPPILSISKSAPDTITLQVLAARGQPCSIDTCTALGSWTTMDTQTSLQGEPLRWDIRMGNRPMSLYRARY
jgi:chitinase